MKIDTIRQPAQPNSLSISVYETPAATRSCTGNFCPSIITPYTATGMR